MKCWIWTTLAIAALLFGGCGGELYDELYDELGAQQRPIVNGKSTSEFPAVGALSTNANTCSGTLIGTKTVVTAAHCLVQGMTHKFFTEGEWGEEIWKAAYAIPHPLYATKKWNYDIAVILLQKQPPVKPMSISSKAPTVGQEVTLVGYGITGPNKQDSGEKRIGKNKVAALWTYQLSYTGASGSLSGICSGDSGGPAFARFNGTLMQVGVHSTGNYYCTSGNDIRVDKYVDWIKQQAKGDVSVDGKPSPFADTKNPTVSFEAPADGAEVAGDVEVRVKASDDKQLAKVALKVDGKAQETLREQPFTWTVKGLAAGEHTLEATAYDQSLNEAKATRKVKVLPPLAEGEACSSDNECGSGICHALGDSPFCSIKCDEDSDCADGALCEWDKTNQRFACGGGPAGSEDSGCSVGPAAPASPLPLSLLLLGLGLALLARRR